MKMNPQKVVQWLEKMEWTPEEIEQCIESLDNDVEKTIVMPKHYEDEARHYAEIYCREVERIKPGSENYDNAYNEACVRFCLEAYLNSRGIEFDGSGENPTWKKAKEAFTIFSRRGFFGKEFMPKYVGESDRKKVLNRIKSAGMDIAHILISYGSKLNVHRVGDKPSDFEMPKQIGKTKEQVKTIYAQVTANNIFRSIVLLISLRLVEQIFLFEPNGMINEFKKAIDEAIKNGKITQKQLVSTEFRYQFVDQFDRAFQKWFEGTKIRGWQDMPLEKFIHQAISGVIPNEPELEIPTEKTLTQDRIEKIETKIKSHRKKSNPESVDVDQPDIIGFTG